MERVEEVKRKKEEKGSRFGKRYGFELKVRCVKLRLEEGLPVSLLSKELGVSKDVVYRWVRAYQERGEEGLRNPVRPSGSRRKLPGPMLCRVCGLRREVLDNFEVSFPFPRVLSGLENGLIHCQSKVPASFRLLVRISRSFLDTAATGFSYI